MAPSSGTPINGFNTEGYISCAFPTLFPTGAPDFVAPRPNAVTVSNYFKHLLMYDDGWFARHPRLQYFALNTEMRCCVLQADCMYVRQHPHDARLSREELCDMVECEGDTFKPCAPLCCQPAWNATVLVQTTEPTDCLRLTRLVCLLYSKHTPSTAMHHHTTFIAAHPSTATTTPPSQPHTPPPPQPLRHHHSHAHPLHHSYRSLHHHDYIIQR